MIAHSKEHSKKFDSRLENILSQTAAIFAKNGYQKTSIRQIAAQVNSSLAGLYYYVQSKEDLLFLIQYHTFEKLVANLQRSLNGSKRGGIKVRDPKEKLKILIDNHLKFFQDHQHELKVCTREFDTLAGEKQHQIAEMQQEYFKLTLQILKEIKDKQPQKPTERQNLKKAVIKEVAFDLKYSTMFLLGALNWLYAWYDPQSYGKPSVKNLAEDFMDLFLEGFLR